MELAAVLVIIGILAALASPAINNVVQSNRLATSTNAFIGSLNLVRSEALKHSSNAILCKSDDGATCTASGTWNSGWIVFVDRDNSGTWSATAGDEDILIRRAEPVPAGVTLTGPSNIIVYSRQGLVSSGSGSYQLCSGTIAQARNVDVALAGRYQMEPGTC